MRITFIVTIFISFILFTVVGTISHELGHILVAKYLGYKTKLNYDSMSYYDSEEQIRFQQIYHNNKEAIKSKVGFYEQEEYRSLAKKLKTNSFFITIGGPLQTILTGTIALFFLIYLRKSKSSDTYGLLEWVLTFISLFWLREPFNLLMAGMGKILGRQELLQGDEFRIARFLDMPVWSIYIVLGLAGLAISSYVILRIIPRKYKIEFLFGGLIGGLFGFGLWFKFLGPYLFE